MTRLARGIAAAGALSLAAHPARADGPSDALLAQSLFEQARTLMDEGRYAEACPKLAESQRLDPGGGTLLNLAVCHEKEGRLATAYAELNAALSQAIKDGRRDREDLAREHIAALSPRVPKLSVHVAGEVADLEISLDATVIRKPAWDVPTGVDPGRHVVEAKAPGHAPFRAEITLAEGARETVTVPRLSPLAAPPPGGLGVAPRASPEQETRTNPLYTGALAVGATGIVVGAIAGGFWIEGLARRSAECTEERQFCSESGLAAAGRERTAAWISTISFSVGLAAMISLPFIPRLRTVDVAPTRGGAALTVSLPSPL